VNVYHKLFTTLSTFVFKAKNNPDFAAAVFIGYGLMTLQTVVQVLLVPLYLKTFGGYRFGALMILISYVGFAFALVGALYTVMLRLFGQAINERDDVQLSSLYIAAKVLAICIALVCGVAVNLTEFVHPVLFGDAPVELRDEIIQALALSTLHLILLCELSVEQTMLAAEGRQAAANLVSLLGLVVFAVTVVPVLFLDGRLVDVMACFIVADVVSRTFAAYLSRRHFRHRLRELFSPCAAAIRRILSSQAREYFALTLITVALQADVLIVAILGGAIAAAKFVLVWKIAEMLTLILSRITQHLQAEFVRMDLRGERARLARVYHEIYWAMASAALCLSVAYAVFGRLIVELWVGQDAVPPEGWSYSLAGLAILWVGIARLPITFALSLDRIKPLVRLAGVELAAKLVVVWLIFPKWGYLAPLIAISVVHVIGVAFGYYALGRSMLVPLRKTAT
jgi:O-antigen/teichoic acid export membrane protein